MHNRIILGSAAHGQVSAHGAQQILEPEGSGKDVLNAGALDQLLALIGGQRRDDHDGDVTDTRFLF